MSLEINCRLPKMETEDQKLGGKRIVNESISIEDGTPDQLMELIKKYAHSFDLKVSIALKEQK